jgi:hypothetical protein
MTKQEYNGWTNYETWNVKLWLDNEESSQRYWQQAAKEALETAKETLSANFRMTGVEPFTTAERAAFELAKALKEQHEEALPELQGFAADLLGAAMSEVNWHEIATSLISDAEEALAPEESATAE